MALKQRRKDIVVLMAPLHGVTATPRELRRARRRVRNSDGHKADFIIHTEGYAPVRKGYFKGLVLWKKFTGPITKPDARGRMASKSMVALTRKRYKTLWKHAEKVADAALPLKYAPDRWLIEWDLKIRRFGYAFIADHPHPGVLRRGNWGMGRRVEYIKQANARRRFILSALGRGLDVIHGGDMNLGRGTREDWYPESIYNDFNMKFVMADVTWLAWSGGLKLVEKTIIEPKLNGQDHNWILVTLRQV